MIDKKVVETIRFLAVDQVNAANSGHPGMPMGTASMAYILWKNHLKIAPKAPSWPSRDRFIMSGGHGSALAYALLHLFGYDMSIDDLKQFRQFGSKTPGHPEYRDVPGIEMTTGPLGQGLASAIGFAIAEDVLSNRHKAIDNYTYVFCGDGDMMEGITSEASSLAGKLGLKKLIVMYDDNNITIDGTCDIAFDEDVEKRYLSYNWEVIKVKDGNNLEELDAAISQAKMSSRPSLIMVKNIIGFGSKNKSNTSGVHGAPLGEEETKLMKKEFGWDPDKEFFVPEEVREELRKIIEIKNKAYDEWKATYADFELSEFELKENDLDSLKSVATGDKATRAQSHAVIKKLAELNPNLIGGSADLAASNKTLIGDGSYYGKESKAARNIAYGIREHAMAAIINGITLYGGINTFGATFLSFADYMKPSIRLAAIMDINSVFVYTHDSIGVGEDGPTHQPIEQLTMLRSIPNVDVYRPCDGIETAVSYYQAYKNSNPACIVLSRQNLKELDIDRTDELKGAYVAVKEKGNLDLILMASGSELAPCVDFANKHKDKMGIRVVSFNCMEVFDRQDPSYKEQVLPSSCKKRFAVEAASDMSWYKYIGLDGYVKAMVGFGSSAPASVLFDHFGFSFDKLEEEILKYYEEN